MQLPYKILGAPGSPYSRKLRSAIRYRRLPYIWANRNGSEDVNTPTVPVNLLPVLVLPGESGDYKEYPKSYPEKAFGATFEERGLRLHLVIVSPCC